MYNVPHTKVFLALVSASRKILGLSEVTHQLEMHCLRLAWKEVDFGEPFKVFWWLLYFRRREAHVLSSTEY